eukprot:6238919-Ditylum_brightwellii.AAC.1
MSEVLFTGNIIKPTLNNAGQAAFAPTKLTSSWAENEFSTTTAPYNDRDIANTNQITFTTR